VIDETIYSGVYRFTDGVPRRINTLCDRLLLYGYLEGLHEISELALGAVTADIVEEHGGLEDDRSLAVPEGAPALAPTNVPEIAPPADANRLSAVEDSVASLASTLKEEMALLRKALIEKSKGGDEESR
jgi:hypothetical protein